MSWGKQILPWSPDGAQALARLIDLNHRYALDGRDPSSYGGLLWCLGAFDRPFTPPAPASARFGPEHGNPSRSVRPRGLCGGLCRAQSRHAPSVAILGAGLAGLTCAQALAEQGWNPTLFDKGRRPGGRLATRESRHSTLAFNHGAQEFEAQDPRFKERLTQWAESGWAVPTGAGGSMVPCPPSRQPSRGPCRGTAYPPSHAHRWSSPGGEQGRRKPNPVVASGPSRVLWSPYLRPSSRN